MTEQPLLTLGVDLFYDGVWNDITSYVYMRDKINITRGIPNEGNTADPSACTLTLDNRDGRFTPRNAASPLYGKIGRNTPLRVRVDDVYNNGYTLWNNGAGLQMKGLTSKAATPDAASLDITGDLDIRCKLSELSWSAPGGQYLVTKVNVPVTDASYYLFLNSDGRPGFGWSADGVTVLTKNSTLSASTVFAAHSAGWVRAILDVDNGAAGNDVKFYTSPDGTTWTQLGTTVTTAGVTSVHAGAVDLEIGTYSGNSGASMNNSYIFKAEVRNGIAGTVVANPDFSAQLGGTTSFLDGTGKTWTITSPAQINTDGGSVQNSPTDLTGETGHVRFTGEVSAWPQNWDTTGSDVYTPIQAAGILRRLGHGQQKADDGPSAFLTAGGFLKAWQGDTFYKINPGSDLRTIVLNNCSSTVHIGGGDFGPGNPPGMLVDSTPTVIASVFPSSGYIQFPVAVSNANGKDEAVGFIFQGPAIGTLRLWMTCYGSTSYWLETSPSLGRFTVWKTVYDPDSGSAISSVCTGPDAPVFTDNALHSVLWKIADAGGTVTHTVYVDGVSVATGSDSLTFPPGIANLQFTYDPTSATNGSSVALGFLSIWSEYFGNTIPSPTAWASAASGYSGEAAGDRISRLCDENGINFQSTGTLSACQLMGSQGVNDLITTLKEAANADMGGLYEPRDTVGLAYKTRRTLYDRAVVAVFNYAAHELGAPPQALDDDQQLTNDVTVSRSGGATAEAILESGPLSIQPPPDGVNTYATSATVNVFSDGQVPDQASWRLALGTIDEQRYPALDVNMVTPAVLNDSALFADIMSIDFYDHIQLTNLPDWLPLPTADLLALGYAESLWQYGWDLTFNCLPWSLYKTFAYADPAATTDADPHFDAEDSTLNSAVTSTDTSLVVTSASNTQLWTTASDAFPFDIRIGGEQITVTGIIGAAGAITFVAAGTSVSANNASVTPGLPAGMSAGDTVLIFASIRNTAATVTTPANWTQINSADPSGNAKVFARVYDGVWTMPAVAFTGGSAGDDTIGQSAAFRGMDHTNRQNGANSTNASAQNIAYTGLTPSTAGRLVVAFGWKQDDWTSVATLASFTEIGEKVATAGNDAGQVWDYWIQTTATNVPNGSFVVTGGASAVSSAWVDAFASAPQRFTVTRSVNGVVAAHATGDQVSLWTPPRFAWI